MPARRLIRVRAPAKINMSLQVVGVRPDGYHDLRTVFQSIALHDTVSVRRARGPLRLDCDDPSCPSDETNLAWRAAARLWTASGRTGAPGDVAIRLIKRVPMQAGLGGGSSDAAATLRALSAWWRVDADRLHEIARSLGADVPYFLDGGTALGVDRGDVLVPLIDVPPFWVTLVVPGFGISTRDAYDWWDLRPPAASAVSPSRRARLYMNDLEPVVVARHPVIGRIVKALERAGALHAAMSGSGSAVFGLFDRRLPAERAAKILAGTVSKGGKIFVTRTVNRDRYRSFAAPVAAGR